MNVIEEQRERLIIKPMEGLGIKDIPPTANKMPRFPQSSIPEPKPRYERAGRPPKGTRPEPQPFRKKPRDIFGGWLNGT